MEFKVKKTTKKTTTHTTKLKKAHKEISEIWNKHYEVIANAYNNDPDPTSEEDESILKKIERIGKDIANINEYDRY